MLVMPRFDDGAIDIQELLRRLAEQVANAVMDAKADQPCGGGANSRNGYRERSLATCVGALTPRIPKPRSGSFFPEGVLGRHRRVGVVDTEPYDSWLAFLRAICSRGAAGARLVVSDACPGLVRAIGEVFRGAAWQRRRDGHAPRGVRHAGGVLPEGGGAGGGRARRAGLPRLSADPLEVPAHQQRAGEDQPGDKAQVFPSTGSLVRLAGAVKCEQDEIWQETRYFSEARMNGLYDGRRTRGIDGSVEWARLEVEARMFSSRP